MPHLTLPKKKKFKTLSSERDQDVRRLEVERGGWRSHGEAGRNYGRAPAKLAGTMGEGLLRD